MNISSELIILKNCFHNDEYLRKIIVKIKPEWMGIKEDEIIIRLIRTYFIEYGKAITYGMALLYFKEKADSLKLADTMKESIIKRILEVRQLEFEQNPLDDLIKLTKEYMQEEGLRYNISYAMKCYSDCPDKKGELPTKFEEVLSFDFETSLGMDYFSDPEERHRLYLTKGKKYPTHLAGVNKALSGGLETGILTVWLGQPNVGKSRMLIDLCCHYLREGLNVLYITLELTELQVVKRFDANLFNIDINNLLDLNIDQYTGYSKNLRGKISGNLVMKYWPNGSISCVDIKAFIEELRQKKNFKPQVIAIDYLGLLSTTSPSDRAKTYTYLKIVSEEMKALAGYYSDALTMTAGQLNKGGWNTLDIGLEDVAESAAIGHVADIVFGMAVNEALKNENKQFIRLMKSRISDANSAERDFFVGVDNSRMRHYDVTSDSSSIKAIQLGSGGSTIKDVFKEVESKFEGINFT